MDIKDTRPPPTLEEERERTILRILQRVWTYHLTTKSDDARTFADEFAEASSRGFLTTRVVFGLEVYGRLWKITGTGLDHLERHAHKIADEEVMNYGQICQP